MESHWFDWFNEARRDPSSVDLADWMEWIHAQASGKGPISTPEWKEAIDRGLFETRAQYLSTLRRICISLGHQQVTLALQESDQRILVMIRTLDEVNSMINHLVERLVDWYGTRDPTFTRKDPSMNEVSLLTRMRENGEGIFLSCIEEAERLIILRKDLSREVSHQAETCYPNCSALLGGLVAARLVARAGGLFRLSRMPAASIQVIGAETALFSHLHAGTPPPKHGIIYQHRRVHAAPRGQKGKVARTLASRVALAARVDYYRKTLDSEFIRKSQDRIDRAGKSV